MRKKVHEAVAKYKDRCIALSDDLAEHPELSSEEFESSRKIAELLKCSNAYSVQFPFCGYETAFLAELNNGGMDCGTVAILAEYDALPDIGHACGHNVHGAMSVLAGLALADLRDCFSGKILVIGTPAEEMDGAKIGMADNGVFDGVDLAMMFHCSSGGKNQMALALLALKGYDFTFKGGTAHAALSPWRGRNALAAARKFLDLIDARRQCFMPDMRVNGIFIEGGKVTNVIPDRAVVRIEARGDTLTKANHVFTGIENCAKGAALALDCEVEWKPYLSDFADMVRNSEAEDAMQRVIESLGMVISPVSPPSGSSDIGNVSYRCPAIQPMLSITDDDCALHTIEFARETKTDFAHDVLVKGAEALVLMTLEVLNDPALRERMAGKFRRSVG